MRINQIAMDLIFFVPYHSFHEATKLYLIKLNFTNKQAEINGACQLYIKGIYDDGNICSA